MEPVEDEKNLPLDRTPPPIVENTFRMGGEGDQVSTPATSGYLKPALFSQDYYSKVTEFDQ